MAPYQQKRHLTSAGTSVTETLPKETNQAMLRSLFPPAHNESQENQTSDCGQKRLKSGPTSFHLHTFTRNKFEGKRLSSTQEDKPFASFPLLTQETRRAQKPNQSRLLRRHATPGTACPGLFGSLKLRLPPPSLVGRGELHRQLYVAR